MALILTFKQQPMDLSFPSEYDFEQIDDLTYKLISKANEEPITSINNSAFNSCESLESVAIPDSVNTIGNCAFSDCTSLKSVVIPNSVNTIGNCAFTGCTSLESIVIPNSVNTIGKYAFYFCTSLKIITINGQTTEYLEKYFRSNHPKIDLVFPDQFLLK